MIARDMARNNWRRVWREGFVPGLSNAALRSLRDALRADDPRLIQKSTTIPPPLMCIQDWPVEAGCALGYMGAVVSGGFGTATVGEAEQFFARACFDADQRLGEAAACRFFLQWFDDEARPEVFRELVAELVAEVAAELERRESRTSDLILIADVAYSRSEARAILAGPGPGEGEGGDDDDDGEESPDMGDPGAEWDGEQGAL